MCRALQKALYLVASHKVSEVQDEPHDNHLQMNYLSIICVGVCVPWAIAQCSLRNVAPGRVKE